MAKKKKVINDMKNSRFSLNKEKNVISAIGLTFIRKAACRTEGNQWIYKPQMEVLILSNNMMEVV